MYYHKSKSRLIEIIFALMLILSLVLSIAVLSRTSGAIVGGETVGGYEWMVAFVDPNDGTPIESRLECSGVLISPSKVLTAKHCQVSGTTVVIGRGDLHDSANSETRTVANIEVNNNTHLNGDMKLVTLSSPSTHDYMLIARSFHAQYWNPGDLVRSYGYGCTSFDGGSSSRYLKRAEFRIVTLDPTGPEATNEGYLAPYYFVSHWDGRGLCPGDSGGPTITSTPDGPRLVGLNTGAGSDDDSRESNFHTKIGNRGSRDNSPLFYWLYDKGILPTS